MEFFKSKKANENTTQSIANADGCDSFDLCLGDVMRGERATMAKSLLDVEKELKIKASYIAAIENTDPNAFETPGFIAGYVRSYARYLGMDPDQTFESFCRESGFQTAHGMSAQASNKRTVQKNFSDSAHSDKYEAIFKPGTPFLPEEEGFLARIEPGALGSSVVLLALIAVIGYGAWSVLNEVQKVRLAPVENAPEVLSDLDPVTGRDAGNGENNTQLASAQFDEQADRLDRLYRPQALDLPVMIARDGPISTLDPASVGALPATSAESTSAMEKQRALNGSSASMSGVRQLSGAQNIATLNTALALNDGINSPQVVESTPPALRVIAVRPSWVQIRSAENTVLFEGVMNAGQQFDVPQTEEPATMKVGESGSVYFEMANQVYGPAGARGAVTSNIELSTDQIAQDYTTAELESDKDLSNFYAKLDVPADQAAPVQE